MSINTKFDFTVEELYRAFRLVVCANEARRQADAVVEAFSEGDEDWAISTELLVLLSLATPSGRAKADRIRRSGQEDRITVELSAQPASGATSPDEIRARIAAEEAEWEARREDLRRSLPEAPSDCSA